MDFIGQLKLIGEIESFETSKGTFVQTRDIVLQTDEQFPRCACITLRNELAVNFNYNVGQALRVSFDINARPSKSNLERYFNHLTAWRISPC